MVPMLDYFYQIPDMLSFIILAAIITAISVILIVINKYFIIYIHKYRDNTITASVASLIGIIYGVLIGFICLYLMTNNDHAVSAVLHEASAAANIYRDSKWLNQPAQAQIQTSLRQYISNVITNEWPAMQGGKSPHQGNGSLINQISNELMNYPIITPKDSVIVTDLLQEIKSLFNGRQERINHSEEQLSPEIWFVILIGTALLIVINYAFRVNFYLHLFSMTAFSIMAASVIFLLITLDRPFQGEFAVGPEPLQTVLNQMDQDMKPKP
jgi:Protein of unknown function (DUF4239)